MPNRQYEKGRRAEYELIRDAVSHGGKPYRGAGSHGAYDVAITALDGVRYLVNIKCNSWAPPAERVRLARVTHGGEVALLARRRDRHGWEYRTIYRNGDMGEISTEAPWQ